MSVNKNFVIKNGLEVSTGLILANASTNQVGIATTSIKYTLHVNGGIGATNIYVSSGSTINILSGNTLNYNAGTITNIIGTGLSISGISTLTSISGTIGTFSNLISTGLSISGISTIQGLQVTDNAYISGSVGIGTTNPIQPFQIGYAGTIRSFVLDTNGNIGLGTITPTSTISEGVSHRTLHFYSPNSRQISIKLDNGNTGGNAWLLQSSGGLAGNGQGKFSIYDNNAGLYRFTIDGSGNVGVATTNPTSTLHVYGDSKFIGIITATTFDGQINSGFATITTLNGTTGTITNIVGTRLSISGISTLASISGTIGTITTLNSTTGTITNLNSTTAIIENIVGTGLSISGIGTIQGLQVVGVSTFANGPVLIGSATTTGTSAQRLQVTGGAYVSGSVGIGTTNPNGILQVGFASTQSVVISGVGSIGIGTINPLSKFDLIGVARMGGNDGLDVYTLTYADPSTTDTISIETINRTNTIKKNLALNAYGGNVLIGSATTTGTSSQRLQVTGGTYVSGSVGVGTTNPTSKLHVIGNANIDGIVTASSYSGSGVNLAGIVTQIVAGTNVSISPINGTGSVTINSFASDSYWTQTAAGIHALSNIGIGTTNPSSKLDVVGNVKVSGIITCADINSTSDINLKNNIQTFTNGLDVVNNLRGVRFEWKKTHKPSIGVIAQELEEVLPELVNGDNPKTVNYNGIIGVLIEAIKELKLEVEELKNSK